MKIKSLILKACTVGDSDGYSYDLDGLLSTKNYETGEYITVVVREIEPRLYDDIPQYIVWCSLRDKDKQYPFVFVPFHSVSHVINLVEWE